MKSIHFALTFTLGSAAGSIIALGVRGTLTERTCPQLVRELEHSKLEIDRTWGVYQAERDRAEEFRAMLQELLRERGLPDNVPELPPQRDAATD